MKYFDNYHRLRPFKEVVLYCAGGGIAFWLTFGVTSFFTEIIVVHYLISSVVGYIAGFTFNFWFQDKVTFLGERFIPIRFLGFFVVQCIGLLLFVSLEAMFTEWFNIFYQWSLVISSGIVAIITFLGSKFFVFREKKKVA